MYVYILFLQKLLYSQPSSFHQEDQETWSWGQASYHQCCHPWEDNRAHWQWTQSFKQRPKDSWKRFYWVQVQVSSACSLLLWPFWRLDLASAKIASLEAEPATPAMSAETISEIRNLRQEVCMIFYILVPKGERNHLPFIVCQQGPD